MLVYDSAAKAVLLFGGWYETPNSSYHRLGDTWSFFVENGTWIPRNPRTSPAPRSDAAVAYDEAEGITLLFGGLDGEHYLGDIWTFNTTQLVWRNVSTPGGPSPRMAAVGGYDPLDDVLVLYGGGDDYEVKADTWFFRYPPPLVGNVFVSSPSPVVGQQVAFSAGIVGGSGALAQVFWDFGDGQTSHAGSPVHTFGAPGIYRIQFNGKDTRGAQFVWTLDLDVGLFVPFWMDVAFLLIGLSALSILMLVWIRRRRKLVP